ncbi:hypothetical protein R1sor_001782 [Riccia sorocarpa]|uniref:Uncharacterized protein n=1 Tax=Riccia sorocarpa TaxID=122646 RepID=A0ABD3GWW8_9MARC
MASSSRKRMGNDPVPQEEHEEGELLPSVPVLAPAKEKGSGSSQNIFTKDQRLRENAEMRHAWFRWFTNEEDLDKCRKEFWTQGAEGIPGHLAEQYDMWLRSPQFDEWTLEREKTPYSFRWTLRTDEEVRTTYRNRAKVRDG